MKFKIELLGVYLASIAFAGAAGTTLNFDDLSPGGSGNYVLIPNGYGGLQWNNFGALDGSLRPVTEGYRTGMVSPNNVAFTLFGDPGSLSSPGGPITLDSAYLTAAFVDGLQVEVRGLLGATLLYDNTYTLHTSGPTLIQFNYVGVNQIQFIPVIHPSGFFAMDNLAVTVPEPTAAALLVVGLVLQSSLVLRTRRDAVSLG